MRRQSENADICGVLGDRLGDHGGGLLLLQPHLDERMGSKERAQLLRQVAGDRGNGGENAHVFAHAARVVEHLRVDLVQVVKHPARQIDECHPGRGGLDALVAARKELGVERVPRARSRDC